MPKHIVFHVPTITIGLTGSDIRKPAEPAPVVSGEVKARIGNVFDSFAEEFEQLQVQELEAGD